MPDSILKYFLSIIFLLLLVSLQVSAQQVSNVNARLSGENVIITYDLVGAKVGQKFRIELYSSHDNYQSPLKEVSGDVGENQLGGSGKQITWRAKQELHVFSGNVTFEVRSTITFSPIQITSPTSSSSFKTGSSLPVKWSGGMPNSTLQLELLKSNSLSRTIGTTANTGLYTWPIPKDLEKGSDFSLKMYDPSDRANTEIVSSNFVIKGAGSPAKFLIPLAVVGAGAGVFLALKGGGPEDPVINPPIEESLPSPPDPSGSVGSARIKSGKPWFVIPISF